MPSSDQLQREQQHLDTLYDILDHRRRAARQGLADALTQPPGTNAAWLERTAAVERLQRSIHGFDAAEHGLCFGRLDLDDGISRYLGRIGLRSDDPDADPLLVDWRSEAARPFYTATAATRQGVRRRRHLHTRGRQLLRVDDELLDGGSAPADLELVGEAALLATLQADRTGRMGAAIATLQTEQDRIIRSAASGVLVVQGGPGTGKTVVALHRAAYLLYTQPTLARRGVLVVGPNPLFLQYIQDVLPGLGETSVLLAAIGDLFPGVHATAPEPETVTALKGSLRMAAAIRAAVRSFQADVEHDVTVDVGGAPLTIGATTVTELAGRARAAHAQHNRARIVFARLMIGELARKLVDENEELQDRFEAEVLTEAERAALDRAVARDLGSVLEPEDAGDTPQQERDQALAHWRTELAGDPAVRRAVGRLWPRLTPEQLVTALFRTPSRAGEVLTEHEQALLHRAPGGDWTPSDVPLLDEAAELLGEDRRTASVRAARARAAALEYAQGVLDIARGSRAPEDDDPDAAERVSAADLVDAAALADRHDEEDLRPLAERAAADRTWAFGHVIVDEAQELAPMAWRMLLRRCPAGSFTVVGDMAQTGQAGDASSWDDALAPFFADRWRLERLTINYRTPAEIMGAADRVLAELGAHLEPARAIRQGGQRPSREHADPGRLAARLADLARASSGTGDGGRVAVLVPEQLVEPVGAEIGSAATDLESPVVVLSPRQAKGLEFDVVLLGDPDGVVAGSARGLNDLYVALTRATRRLHVVHPGPVPDLLAGLEPATP